MFSLYGPGQFLGSMQSSKAAVADSLHLRAEQIAAAKDAIYTVLYYTVHCTKTRKIHSNSG